MAVMEIEIVCTIVRHSVAIEFKRHRHVLAEADVWRVNPNQGQIQVK